MWNLATVIILIGNVLIVLQSWEDIIRTQPVEGLQFGQGAGNPRRDEFGQIIATSRRADIHKGIPVDDDEEAVSEEYLENQPKVFLLHKTRHSIQNGRRLIID